LFALLALLLPVPASGQTRLQSAFAANSTPSPSRSLASQQQRSTARMVTFGLVGGVAGLLGGGLAGAFIGNDEDDVENGWIDALRGSVIGGTIGESVGLAIGVHFGNDRQGNLVLGTLASLAIGAVGTALVVENQDPPAAPIILTMTPLAQFAATVLIERKTR
jgi:hypothetical protein